PGSVFTPALAASGGIPPLAPVGACRTRRFGGALAAGGRSVAVTAAAAPSAAPTPAPFAAGTVVAVGGAGGFAFPARRAILGLVGLRHALGLDDDAAHAGVADAVGFHVRVVLKGHVDD